MPSAFSITRGVLPSMTATQELVVPRSIPMTFAIGLSFLHCGRSAGPCQRPKNGERRADCSRSVPLSQPPFRFAAPLAAFSADIGGRHNAASGRGGIREAESTITSGGSCSGPCWNSELQDDDEYSDRPGRASLYP